MGITLRKPSLFNSVNQIKCYGTLKNEDKRKKFNYTTFRCHHDRHVLCIALITHIGNYTPRIVD